MSSDTTQTAGLYEILAWLETNKKTVAVGFVAAVVVWFGVEVYQWRTDQVELSASDALLSLKTPIGGDTNAPAPAADYLKVAAQYPSTAAGQRASLLAAGALFAEAKYTQAHDEFAKFLRERPQSPFAATAAYGVATCLEAEGKQDEALAAYQNLPVRFPGAGVLGDAKLAMARIYEAKKQPELALRAYDELTKSAAMMDSTASEAFMRRQDLLSQHPELAKTNAPANTLTNTITLPKAAVPVSSPTAAPKATSAPAGANGGAKK
jgi:predicted negative regulator of RcsB-dependent stress response